MRKSILTRYIYTAPEGTNSAVSNVNSENGRSTGNTERSSVIVTLGLEQGNVKENGNPLKRLSTEQLHDIFSETSEKKAKYVNLTTDTGATIGTSDNISNNNEKMCIQKKLMSRYVSSECSTVTDDLPQEPLPQEPVFSKNKNDTSDKYQPKPRLQRNKHYIKNTSDMSPQTSNLCGSVLIPSGEIGNSVNLPINQNNVLGNSRKLPQSSLIPQPRWNFFSPCSTGQNRYYNRLLNTTHETAYKESFISILDHKSSQAEHHEKLPTKVHVLSLEKNIDRQHEVQPIMNYEDISDDELVYGNSTSTNLGCEMNPAVCDNPSQRGEHLKVKCATAKSGNYFKCGNEVVNNGNNLTVANAKVNDVMNRPEIASTQGRKNMTKPVTQERQNNLKVVSVLPEIGRNVDMGSIQAHYRNKMTDHQSVNTMIDDSLEQVLLTKGKPKDLTNDNSLVGNVGSICTNLSEDILISKSRTNTGLDDVPSRGRTIPPAGRGRSRGGKGQALGRTKSRGGTNRSTGRGGKPRGGKSRSTGRGASRRGKTPSIKRSTSTRERNSPVDSDEVNEKDLTDGVESSSPVGGVTSHCSNTSSLCRGTSRCRKTADVISSKNKNGKDFTLTLDSMTSKVEKNLIVTSVSSQPESSCTVGGDQPICERSVSNQNPVLKMLLTKGSTIGKTTSIVDRRKVDMNMLIPSFSSEGQNDMSIGTFHMGENLAIENAEVSLTEEHPTIINAITPQGKSLKVQNIPCENGRKTTIDNTAPRREKELTKDNDTLENGRKSLTEKVTPQIGKQSCIDSTTSQISNNVAINNATPNEVKNLIIGNNKSQTGKNLLLEHTTTSKGKTSTVDNASTQTGKNSTADNTSQTGKNSIVDDVTSQTGKNLTADNTTSHVVYNSTSSTITRSESENAIPLGKTNPPESMKSSLHKTRSQDEELLMVGMTTTKNIMAQARTDNTKGRDTLTTRCLTWKDCENVNKVNTPSGVDESMIVSEASLQDPCPLSSMDDLTKRVQLPTETHPFSNNPPQDQNPFPVAISISETSKRMYEECQHASLQYSKSVCGSQKATCRGDTLDNTLIITEDPQASTEASVPIQTNVPILIPEMRSSAEKGMATLAQNILPTKEPVTASKYNLPISSTHKMPLQESMMGTILNGAVMPRTEPVTSTALKHSNLTLYTNDEAAESITSKKSIHNEDKAGAIEEAIGEFRTDNLVLLSTVAAGIQHNATTSTNNTTESNHNADYTMSTVANCITDLDKGISSTHPTNVTSTADDDEMPTFMEPEWIVMGSSENIDNIAENGVNTGPNSAALLTSDNMYDTEQIVAAASESTPLLLQNSMSLDPTDNIRSSQQRPLTNSDTGSLELCDTNDLLSHSSVIERDEEHDTIFVNTYSVDNFFQVKVEEETNQTITEVHSGVESAKAIQSNDISMAEVEDESYLIPQENHPVTDVQGPSKETTDPECNINMASNQQACYVSKVTENLGDVGKTSNTSKEQTQPKILCEEIMNGNDVHSTAGQQIDTDQTAISVSPEHQVSVSASTTEGDERRGDGGNTLGSPSITEEDEEKQQEMEQAPKAIHDKTVLKKSKTLVSVIANDMPSRTSNTWADKVSLEGNRTYRREQLGTGEEIEKQTDTALEDSEWDRVGNDKEEAAGQQIDTDQTTISVSPEHQVSVSVSTTEGDELRGDGGNTLGSPSITEEDEEKQQEMEQAPKAIHDKTVLKKSKTPVSVITNDMPSRTSNTWTDKVSLEGNRTYRREQLGTGEEIEKQTDTALEDSEGDRVGNDKEEASMLTELSTSQQGKILRSACAITEDKSRELIDQCYQNEVSNGTVTDKNDKHTLKRCTSQDADDNHKTVPRKTFSSYKSKKYKKAVERLEVQPRESNGYSSEATLVPAGVLSVQSKLPDFEYTQSANPGISSPNCIQKSSELVRRNDDFKLVKFLSRVSNKRAWGKDICNSSSKGCLKRMKLCLRDCILERKQNVMKKGQSSIFKDAGEPREQLTAQEYTQEEDMKEIKETRLETETVQNGKNPDHQRLESNFGQLSCLSEDNISQSTIRHLNVDAQDMSNQGCKKNSSPHKAVLTDLQSQTDPQVKQINGSLKVTKQLKNTPGPQTDPIAKKAENLTRKSGNTKVKLTLRHDRNFLESFKRAIHLTNNESTTPPIYTDRRTETMGAAKRQKCYNRPIQSVENKKSTGNTLSEDVGINIQCLSCQTLDSECSLHSTNANNSYKESQNRESCSDISVHNNNSNPLSNSRNGLTQKHVKLVPRIKQKLGRFRYVKTTEGDKNSKIDKTVEDIVKTTSEMVPLITCVKGDQRVDKKLQEKEDSTCTEKSTELHSSYTEEKEMIQDLPVAEIATTITSSEEEITDECDVLIDQVVPRRTESLDEQPNSSRESKKITSGEGKSSQRNYTATIGTVDDKEEDIKDESKQRMSLFSLFNELAQSESVSESSDHKTNGGTVPGSNGSSVNREKGMKNITLNFTKLAKIKVPIRDKTENQRSNNPLQIMEAGKDDITVIKTINLGEKGRHNTSKDKVTVSRNVEEYHHWTESIQTITVLENQLTQETSKETHTTVRAVVLNEIDRGRIRKGISKLKAAARKGDIEKVDIPIDSSKRRTCEHCEITYDNMMLYIMHRGFHGPRGRFHCSICGKLCSTSIEFNVHLSRHPLRR
ncbi:uncharacterized protein LOC144449547 [Glandiceps talaboti]